MKDLTEQSLEEAMLEVWKNQDLYVRNLSVEVPIEWYDHEPPNPGEGYAFFRYHEAYFGVSGVCGGWNSNGYICTNLWKELNER